MAEASNSMTPRPCLQRIEPQYYQRTHQSFWGQWVFLEIWMLSVLCFAIWAAFTSHLSATCWICRRSCNVGCIATAHQITVKHFTDTVLRHSFLCTWSPFGSIEIWAFADYSCGCMDYGYRRDKEPWEASDGAVFLLSGLAEFAPQTIASFMPTLADISLLDNFPQASSLQTTIWNELPIIMRGMGKRVSTKEELRLSSSSISSYIHVWIIWASGPCNSSLRIHCMCFEWELQCISSPDYLRKPSL